MRFFIQPQVMNENLKQGLGRWVPVISSLVTSDPFWLDTKDPHLAPYVREAVLGPTMPSYNGYNPAWGQVNAEQLWGVAHADVIKNGATPAAAPAPAPWSRRTFPPQCGRQALGLLSVPSMVPRCVAENGVASTMPLVAFQEALLHLVERCLWTVQALHHRQRAGRVSPLQDREITSPSLCSETSFSAPNRMFLDRRSGVCDHHPHRSPRVSGLCPWSYLLTGDSRTYPSAREREPHEHQGEHRGQRTSHRCE